MCEPLPLCVGATMNLRMTAACPAMASRPMQPTMLLSINATQKALPGPEKNAATSFKSGWFSTGSASPNSAC